jgi:hypothetical protein
VVRCRWLDMSSDDRRSLTLLAMRDISPRAGAGVRHHLTGDQMYRRRWIATCAGVLLLVAAWAPEGALAASRVKQVAETPLTSSALGSLPAVANTRGDFPCGTFPGEYCYVYFIMNVGHAVAQADFSSGEHPSLVNYCNPPYVACTFTDVAIPGNDNIAALNWYISAPGLRNVETY